MVSTLTKVMSPGDRMKARMKRVADLRKIDGVRVVPAAGEGWTEDDMRRLLKHPKAGAFRAEGSIEWPNDTFTQRRLREGSIKLESEHHEHDDKHRPRLSHS